MPRWGPEGELWLSWSCVQSYVSLYISTVLSTFFPISGNALCPPPISTPINKPVSDGNLHQTHCLWSEPWRWPEYLTIEMTEGQSNRVLEQIGREVNKGFVLLVLKLSKHTFFSWRVLFRLLVAVWVAFSGKGSGIHNQISSLLEVIKVMAIAMRICPNHGK